MKDADIQRLRHMRVYCEDIAAYVKRFGEDCQVFYTDSAYFVPNAKSERTKQAVREMEEQYGVQFRPPEPPPSSAR